jgi:hypothetical protein
LNSIELNTLESIAIDELVMHTGGWGASVGQATPTAVASRSHEAGLRYLQALGLVTASGCGAAESAVSLTAAGVEALAYLHPRF